MAEPAKPKISVPPPYSFERMHPMRKRTVVNTLDKKSERKNCNATKLLAFSPRGPLNHSPATSFVLLYHQKHHLISCSLICSVPNYNRTTSSQLHSTKGDKFAS